MRPLSVALKEVERPKIRKDRWVRNTFPGEGHLRTTHIRPWGPGQGSDKSEVVMSFKVSPANPDFMMQITDLGPLMYTNNGSEFLPAEVPVRGGESLAFNPHDGNVGYALLGDDTKQANSSGLNGWWRTNDQGVTWEQMYPVPPTSFEPHGERPLMRNMLRVDPSPARRNHIYIASFHRGLLRSRDNGRTWEVMGLKDRTVKHISAGTTEEGHTVLYVVEGGPAPATVNEFNRIMALEIGQAWRVDVRDDGAAAFTRLHFGPGRQVTDIEVDPEDASSGAMILDRQDIYRFGDFGGTLEKKLYRYRKPKLHTVQINPWNNQHIIANARRDMTRGFLYSSDGGETWKGYGRDQTAGVAPCCIDYSPTNTFTDQDFHVREPKDRELGGHGRFIDFIKGEPSTVVGWLWSWSNGPQRSEDYGESWRPFGHGGSFKMPRQMAIGASDDVIAIGRGEYGIMLTENGGLSWKTYSGYNHPKLWEIFLEAEQNKAYFYRNLEPHGVGLSPKDPNLVVMAYSEKPRRILRSEDLGRTWEQVATQPWEEHRTWRNSPTSYLYWNQQDPNVLYVDNIRSKDAGKTWEKLKYPVLGMCSGNGNIVIGQSPYTRDGNVKKTDFELMLSLDAGQTWSKLPDPPLVKSYPEHKRYLPIRFDRAMRDIAIDPSPKHDPTRSKDNRLRVLFAGREGIYEFKATNHEATEGEWNLYTEGLKPKNMQVGVIEAFPYLGIVAFDPRPGKHHIVYTASPQRGALSYWRSKNNTNKTDPMGTSYRAIFRSMDGGKTWGRITAPEYPGIPDFTDTYDMVVSPHTGTVYIQDFTGQFALGAPE